MGAAETASKMPALREEVRCGDVVPNPRVPVDTPKSGLRSSVFSRQERGGKQRPRTRMPAGNPRGKSTGREEMTTLANRLVQLIEMHSDRLAETMLMKLQGCDKCPSFKNVTREEFRQRVYEIYEHLDEWLTHKQEEDIARRYIEIGRQRERQGVLLSELIYAIMLTREHLWEYVQHEVKMKKPAEIFGELELLQLLEQFFDRALYYAARGYEQARASRVVKGGVRAVGR